MSKKSKQISKKLFELRINNSYQIAEECASKELRRIIYRHTKTTYKTNHGRSSKVHTYTTEEIREYQKGIKEELL